MPGDWLDVYVSHTPYEWSVQCALADVEPWGEDREDFRAAVNTLRIVMCLATKELSEQEIINVLNGLRFYLKCNQVTEEIADPKLVKRILEGEKP